MRFGAFLLISITLNLLVVLMRVQNQVGRILRSCLMYSGINDYAKFYDLSNNRDLCGLGKTRRAFLLATGPSVQSQDLSRIAEMDCFTCSNAYLHDDINLINPKFHFFAPYHLPIDRTDYLAWLKHADEVLPNETKIFLSYSDKSMIESQGIFSHRCIHYQFNIAKAFRGSFDLMRPINGPATAPLMILPVLLYMGYSEIYLLGCDHTLLRDYGRGMTNFYDPNKDVRRCNSGAVVWGDNGVLESLMCEITVHKMYEVYAKMAKSIGTYIINLSNDTWLKMFPVMDFDQVMECISAGIDPLCKIRTSG